MKKENLESFKDRLINDVIDKINKGTLYKDYETYVKLYQKEKKLTQLKNFMIGYINCIGKRELDKIKTPVFIELFLDKDFLVKNEDLNQFRNFVEIDEYPIFTFYLRARDNNTGIVGFIYYNTYFDKFDIHFIQRSFWDYFSLEIKNNIKLTNATKTEFINYIRKYFGLSQIKIEHTNKNKLIEEFDEFLSIVLNLNEENKQLIEPLGLNLLENIKNLEKEE